MKCIVSGRPKSTRLHNEIDVREGKCDGLRRRTQLDLEAELGPEDAVLILFFFLNNFE